MCPDATRHVTRRDARLEGEPDAEPSEKALTADEQAMKDTQRDVTSLSGPTHRDERGSKTHHGDTEITER